MTKRVAPIDKLIGQRIRALVRPIVSKANGLTVY
jgi:hypothetical protein